MNIVDNTIYRIEIRDYPDKILMAKARRPVYYLKEDSLLKGIRDIPKSFLNIEKYSFTDKGILINLKTGQPQLANSKSAGKPRYWVVNFQDLWNGNIAKHDRANKVEKLKAVLRPYIKDLKEIDSFPIGIELFIYDIECPVDVSNKGVMYTKVIEDLLVNTNRGEEDNRHIIPDDSVEYINDTGRCKFIKVEDISEKKMEIRIFYSNNLNR